MKILVTGKSGQVASALGRLWSPELEICFIGRPEMDLQYSIDHTEFISRFNPDVIVNAAAYTAVDKAETEPNLAFEINGSGAGRVAVAAASLKIPLIHISTDYVFDGTACRPIGEDTKPNPINVYGESKLAGEIAVSATHPSAIILRVGWIYSQFSKNFLLTMLKLGASREEINVVADQFGLPTSALDLAGTIVAIANKLLRDPGNLEMGGIFHLSPKGDPISWADFAEEIFESSASPEIKATRINRISTSEYPTPARRPKYSCLDPSKLKAIYDIEIPHWRAGMSRVMSEIRGITL